MKWKCNTCQKEKEVVSGECPQCGPTQTTPIDTEALEAAGINTASDEPVEEAFTDEE